MKNLFFFQVKFFRLDHYSKSYDIQTAAVITCILGQRQRSVSQSLIGFKDSFVMKKNFNFPYYLAEENNYTRRHSKSHTRLSNAFTSGGIVPSSSPALTHLTNYENNQATTGDGLMSSFAYTTSAGTAGAIGFYAPHSRSMSVSYDQSNTVATSTIASVAVSFSRTI